MSPQQTITQHEQILLEDIEGETYKEFFKSERREMKAFRETIYSKAEEMWLEEN